MANGPLAPLLVHIRRLTGASADAPMSDGQLLDRFVGQREGEAFAALMARHGALVLGVCRRVLGHEQEVEDAFQATFLVLARKAGSVRRRDSLAGWLYRVAYHVAVTARARAAKRRALERRATDMARATLASAPAGELRLMLDEELNHLPRKYQAPLVLCYLEGKTHEEAARELRWPTGTVKGRLARAREMLRQRLVRRGLALSSGVFGARLVEETAVAAVPAALSEATVKAAAGAVSAEVAALVEGVSRAMFVTKLKIVAAVGLIVGLLVLTAGLVTHRALAAGQTRTESAGGSKSADQLAASTTLTGHTESVLCLACSLDGKWVATGSADKTVRLWDVKNKKEIASLRGHKGAVTVVAFSPDKRSLFSASADKSVKMWDVATKRELRTFAGHTEPVTGLTFSLYGKLLYTRSAEKTVRGWVVETGEEFRRPWEFADAVTMMAGDPAGRWIVLGGGGTGNAGQEMVRWDPANGQEIVRFQGHGGEVTAVVISPDRRKMATASADKTAKLWDLTKGKALATYKGHAGAVRAVAFAPSGRKLATASADKTIKLWDTTTAKELATFKGHSEEVTSLAFSPNGRVFFTGSADKTVKVWTVP